MYVRVFIYKFEARDPGFWCLKWGEEEEEELGCVDCVFRV